MKKIRSITILMLITSVTSFSSIAQTDQATKNEQVKITLIEKPVEKEAVIPAAAWVSIAGVAVSAGSKILKGWGKKYTAAYGSSAIGDDFYLQGYDMRYSGFTLERTVDAPDSVRASFARFNFELSDDRSAFRLIPDSLQIDHAKAKVKRDLDVTFSIQWIATWVSSNGIGQTKELATDEFVFKNISLGQPYSAKDFKNSGGWVPIIPKSATSPAGGGNFQLKVTVVETDDFGKRFEVISDLLGENKDGITSFVEGILEEE